MTKGLYVLTPGANAGGRTGGSEGNKCSCSALVSVGGIRRAFHLFRLAAMPCFGVYGIGVYPGAFLSAMGVASQTRVHAHRVAI